MNDDMNFTAQRFYDSRPKESAERGEEMGKEWMHPLRRASRGPSRRRIWTPLGASRGRGVRGPVGAGGMKFFLPDSLPNRIIVYCREK